MTVKVRSPKEILDQAIGDIEDGVSQIENAAIAIERIHDSIADPAPESDSVRLAMLVMDEHNDQHATGRADFCREERCRLAYDIARG